MSKKKDDTLLEAVGIKREEIQAGIDGWKLAHDGAEISQGDIAAIVKDKLGRDHLRAIANAIASTFADNPETSDPLV